MANSKKSTSYPLSFVVTTDTNQISDASRKLVRKHAILEYHWRMRAKSEAQENSRSDATPIRPRSDDPELASSSTSLTPLQTTTLLLPKPKPGPIRRDSEDDAGKKTSSSFNRTLSSSKTLQKNHRAVVLRKLAPVIARIGNSRQDPFNSYPIPAEGKRDYLIDHFQRFFVSSGSVITSKTRYLNWALTHPAFLHGLLFHMAFHRMAQTGKNLLVDALYHKSEVIRLINREIQTSGLAISDGTIAAIACLAMYEVVRSSSREAEMHMVALEKLVNFRGGLDNLGMGGMVKDTITWGDIWYATSTTRPPRFNQLSKERWEQYSRLFDSLPNVETSEEIVRLSIQCGIRKTLVDIFYGLRSVGNRVNCLQADAKPESLVAIGDQIYFLEHKLLNLPWTGYEQYSCIERSLRIAASIYLYLGLRQISQHIPFFFGLANKLKSSLGDETETVKWTPWRKTYLWVLFIGYWAGSGVEVETWFISEIANVCDSMQILYCTDLKRALMATAWCEKTCKNKCMSLWSELQALRR